MHSSAGDGMSADRMQTRCLGRRLLHFLVFFAAGGVANKSLFMFTKEFLGSFVEEGAFKGKHVLLKADLGIPNGLQSVEPLVQSVSFLNDHGAKTIIIPDPVILTENEALLERQLAQKSLTLVTRSDESHAVVSTYTEEETNEVLILENFYSYDSTYQQSIMNSAAAFVNDSLSRLNRDFVERIPVHCIGYQLRSELDLLLKLRDGPNRPYVALVASDRLLDVADVIHALLSQVDKLLLAGDMLDTFLRAQGMLLSTAELEPDMRSIAEGILNTVRERKVQLILQSDTRILPNEVAAEHLSELATSQGESSQQGSHQHSKGVPLNLDYAHHPAIRLGVKRVPLSVSAKPPGPLFQPVAESKRYVAVQDVPSGWMAVDVGPETVASFSAALEDAASVLWIGSLGKSVHGEYMDASRQLLQRVSELTSRAATTVLCGQRLVDALRWERTGGPHGREHHTRQYDGLRTDRADRTDTGDTEETCDVGGFHSGQAGEGVRDESASMVLEGPPGTQPRADGAEWAFTHICTGGDAALAVLAGQATVQR